MKLPSIIKPPTIYKQQLSATNKGHISASILQNLYVKIKKELSLNTYMNIWALIGFVPLEDWVLHQPCNARRTLDKPKQHPKVIQRESEKRWNGDLKHAQRICILKGHVTCASYKRSCYTRLIQKVMLHASHTKADTCQATRVVRTWHDI